VKQADLMDNINEDRRLRMRFHSSLTLAAALFALGFLLIYSWLARRW
jgi:hypothetical protein